MEEALRKLVDPNNEACCDYHLMAKCKEWAYKNGFIIDSCKISKEKGYSTIETDELKNIYVEPDGYISRSSEQQAVFDACQWILDNKTK